MENIERINCLINSLSKEERSVLKSNLSSKVPLFFDDENNLNVFDEKESSEFHFLAEVLHKLSPYHFDIPDNGIAYKGFPDWLTSSLVQELQKEALLRRDKPLDRIDHFLGCGGKIADNLSTSNEVISFVEKHTGCIQPTGIASYLYYDEKGLGIKPHVDTDVFSINLMIMLNHEIDSNYIPSATLVFPKQGTQESYRLAVGEVMIMYGGNVIHARSIIQETEKVHLLTIGFNRIS